MDVFVDGRRVLKLIKFLFNIVQSVLKYLKLLVQVQAVHQLLAFLLVVTLLQLQELDEIRPWHNGLENKL